MDEKRYEIFGLLGFLVSGLFFFVAGVKAGDPLVITGTVIWMIACGIWLYPLLRK